jgi:hypothetical protein
MALGPALARAYMENHKTIQGLEGSYPSAGSYNLVFLTTGLLSAASIGFAVVRKKNAEYRHVIQMTMAR